MLAAERCLGARVAGHLVLLGRELRSPLLVCLLNLLCLASHAAPGDTCTGADEAGAPVPAQEQAMECMVNFARQEAGLPALKDNRKLDNSSGAKAADILRCNDFSHEACGRDFTFWFRRSGYLTNRCWWAGENIAWGTGGIGTVRSIVKAWLHSPPHRANLLSSRFGDFG